jgi:cell division protein FtsL
MKNLSTFNKIFLLLCAAIILLLAFTVPHEKEEKRVRHVTAASE